jgi:hypothetical protein
VKTKTGENRKIGNNSKLFPKTETQNGRKHAQDRISAQYSTICSTEVRMVAMTELWYSLFFSYFSSFTSSFPTKSKDQALLHVHGPPSSNKGMSFFSPLSTAMVGIQYVVGSVVIDRHYFHGF